ncbi:MBL fold metallo-hydrolase [Corynebacterium doosanense]|uniref:Hydrolase n=1 Tax=Corynebacterium doosanense CAU 212 = DSM 45436 TaxID=558173 RepID=A0A097IGF4_9CORY|nr:MBL fold metallo-hydrolase [Corynebacterium doosanense]AIT61199.1 hydrolase [Corynebacterium doosanense CAU 212 = DSM 45436]
MQLSGFAAGPYKTNTYVISDGDSCVVVDPGMHSYDRVMSLGLRVDTVLLTHGHIDHTRDAGAFGVPVYIHPDDEFMLAAGAGVSEQSRALFDAENMERIDDLRPLTDGSELSFFGESFVVRHTPGHSPGSCLLVHSEFVFAGDVLFRGSIGRTDLPGSDPAAMDASLRGPVWSLPDALAVLPGHGPTTTMATERASNPFLTAL